MSQLAKQFINTTNFNIELVGDWYSAEKAMKFLASKDHGLVRDAARASRTFLERFKWTLVKGIITNGSYVNMPWPEVSSKYNTWKTMKFGISGSELLQASTHYINALLNMRITQHNYLVSMDLSTGDLNKKAWQKGIKMKDYMLINEYGYGAINARPLWEPTFYKLGGHEGCANAIYSAIKKRLANIL